VARVSLTDSISAAVLSLMIPRRMCRALRATAGLSTLLCATRLAGAEIAEVQRALLEGSHAIVIKQASAELREGAGNSEWSLILAQALLTTGKYAEADAAVKEAIAKDARSIRLRWLAREIALALGRAEEAAARVEEIRRAVRDAYWMYRSPADLVVFGRAALAIGADPKEVLEKVFGVAQKSDPKLRDVYLARGELALDKHDFALAAKAYEEGLKVLPDDPDLHFGRARAYSESDRKVARAALQAALEKNSRHVPALLQLADRHIAAEAYEDAEATLEQVVTVNPLQPEAWAYRAVIAHLRGDAVREKSAREKALSVWDRNPRVDTLIGEKLSSKYRFAEGAAYQRRAREMDPDHLPAKSALATDLLRLGETEEGWKLAQEVHEADAYDVEAFNLVTLRDTMAKYATLTNEDFVVRMAAPEVAIYGPRVVALLRRAKDALVPKYGVELAKPTYIEIFADQRDFAVRTFGLPDVAGFLGVCFGRVVTANSPATGNSAVNWEAVLWHEFCHVVTLQMTRNRMPRWLSEGISVHEERNANPAWGNRLNPEYREMILGGEMAPVAKLSAAFLAPKTPRHLQFAYLQSSLVVDYIVAKHGIDALRGVLVDLRDGVEINAALAKRTLPMPELEKAFADYARGRAEQLAPGLNWDRPEAGVFLVEGSTDLTTFSATNPDNYWALKAKAERHAAKQEWKEALVPLRRLVELYPTQKGAGSAHRPLAAALRALGDTAGEMEALRRWAEVDEEATDAYLRLMELASAAKDWPLVIASCERFLGVNPLVPPPYRFLARAAGATGDDSTAVIAWRTLLQLDVPERAEANYELARLMFRRGDRDAARRHVLLALEETPRFREALILLREINAATGGGTQ
jgi:tetratricopeptide (TPR) repeat protein